MNNTERIQYAKELIKNPLYKQLMDELKENTITLWANTDVEQVQNREKYWERFVVCKTLDNWITSYAQQKLEDGQEQGQPAQHRYP